MVLSSIMKQTCTERGCKVYLSPHVLTEPYIANALSQNRIKLCHAILNNCVTPIVRSAIMKHTCTLAFTRYSFRSRPLYKNQHYIWKKIPMCWHPSPPLHRLHYCAIQCFPPITLCCNTCHTILAMTISCKGQHAWNADARYI